MLKKLSSIIIAFAFSCSFLLFISNLSSQAVVVQVHAKAICDGGEPESYATDILNEDNHYYARCYAFFNIWGDWIDTYCDGNTYYGGGYSPCNTQ